VAQNGDHGLSFTYLKRAGVSYALDTNDTPNRYYLKLLLLRDLRAPKRISCGFQERPEDDGIHVVADSFLTKRFMQRLEYLVLNLRYHKTVLLLLYYAKNFTDAQMKEVVHTSHTQGNCILDRTTREQQVCSGNTKKARIYPINKTLHCDTDISALEKETKDTDRRCSYSSALHGRRGRTCRRTGDTGPTRHWSAYRKRPRIDSRCPAGCPFHDQPFPA